MTTTNHHMGAQGVLCFGEFTLDRKNWTLYCKDTPLKMEPKTFDILMLLVDRAGQTVSKEEILQHVWSNVVIEENGLARNISLLRAALGDKPPYRYIETVMGEGYRFSAPLTDADIVVADGSAVSVPSDMPSAVTKRSHKGIYYIAAMIAIAAIITGVLVFRSQSVVPTYAATQLTTRSSETPIAGAAISRSGKLMAISHDGRVYISDIYAHSQYELPLPPELAVNEVQWFPDSVNLLLGATDTHTGQSGLWIVSILRERRADLVIPNAHIAAVFPDGQRIVFVRNDNELWIANRDGSKSTFLARSPDNAYFWSRPEVSRDMRHVVNVVTHKLTRRSEVIAYRIDTGSGLTLYDTDGYIVDFALLDDNTLIAAQFPNVRIIESEVVEVAIDLSREQHKPATIRRIGYWPGYVSRQITVSEDHKSIALLNGRHLQQIVLSDIDATHFAISNERKITHNHVFNYVIGWYPDSSRVLIESAVDGHYGIYSQALNASEMVALAKGNEDNIRAVVDSTQNWLFFFTLDTNSTAPDTPAKLLRMPLAGGEPTVIDTRRDRQWRMRCASKAKRCVLAENHESQTAFVELLPDSGQRTELAKIKWADSWPMYDWDLSSDGTRIVHLAPAIGSDNITDINVLALDKQHHDHHLHLDNVGNLLLVRWDAQGTGFFVTHNKVEEEAICLMHVDLNGNAKNLRCDSNVPNNFATPSPDGKHLAFHKWQLNDNIWLLQRKE